MKPKKLLSAVILSSLALSGCGGGGGGGGGGAPVAPPASNPPPNTNVLNNPPQLWAPFYSITTGGSTPVYGSLQVDSITRPVSTLPITSAAFDGPQTSLSYIDSSGMLSATGSGFTVQGVRYFFYSSGGKLYAVDLTASQPAAVQLGVLGATQVCGIQAEQFDGSGTTGDVIVSGVTSGNACTSLLTWVVPFGTPSTTAITPLTFHEFLVATFISANSSNIQTTGYVIGVTQSNGTSSVNYTTDPASMGTPVSGIAYNSATESLASDRGGDATHQFVWVYDHSTTPTTSNLFSVSPNGTSATAAAVTGLPGNLSNNTATDGAGNLYLVAITGTAAPFNVQVFRAPIAGGAAQPVTASFSVTGAGPISTKLSVNQQGTYGMLTVTGSGTPQTNQNYQLSLAGQSAQPLNNFAGNAGSAMQFIGLDGSGVINAVASSQNDVYAVNLTTGSPNPILSNQIGLTQLWSSNQIELPNLDSAAYGSFLAQDSSSGVVSVIGTQTYQTTGQFSVPNSLPFTIAALDSTPHYIMGMQNSTGVLFAAVPASSAANAQVQPLGTNTSTVFWSGY